MKSCYIIALELSPNLDYSGLEEAIRGYGTWARITETCWAVVSESKASEIRDHLKQAIGPKDRLFVLKSATAAAWSNVRCRNEWLKKNL